MSRPAPVVTALRRLRQRQAHDRTIVASRLLSEALHPSRAGHLPHDTRLSVAIHLRAAGNHLEAAAKLVEQARTDEEKAR